MATTAEPKAPKAPKSRKPKAPAQFGTELYRAVHFLLEHAMVQNPDLRVKSKTHQELIAQEQDEQKKIAAQSAASETE